MTKHFGFEEAHIGQWHLFLSSGLIRGRKLIKDHAFKKQRLLLEKGKARVSTGRGL